MRIIAFIFSSIYWNVAVAQHPIKTEIVETPSGYQFMVDGNPFVLKGAGLEFGSIPKLAEHGGNIFRTWRTDNGERSAIEVLDEAHQYGIKVMMGIEVARERHGFDYNDTAAVKAQLADIRKQVFELKDHPALAIWGIGNELNLRATNPAVWDAVNEISKMIHQIDTNHITTTSLAGIDSVLWQTIQERAPDLDIISIQMYGEVERLPQWISASGLQGPYLLTEWGATGHWEVTQTEWGVPIENNSTVKANAILHRYQQAIVPQQATCIGSFIFLWGQKQERTPTWYGLFLKDGTETPAVDVMHYIWNGTWPENRSPEIISFTLNNLVATDNIYVEPGSIANALVVLEDPENDKLRIQWELMPESTDLKDGGDTEMEPPVFNHHVLEQGSSSTQVKMPETEGAYRLFLYAYDQMGHAAHANIPFYVLKKSE